MSDAAVESALRFLRANTTADLRFDEHIRPLKYVIDPDGRIVFPAMVAMLRAEETVLFAPDASEDAMELLVTLGPFEESGADGALADRWRIYHGEPEDVRWARAEIDAVRFGGFVIDGEGFTAPNPIIADEPALCREMNADRDRLRAICRAAGQDSENPVMVGVDPLGIDVRRRFDVVRIEFPREARTGDDVRAMLETMSAE